MTPSFRRRQPCVSAAPISVSSRGRGLAFAAALLSALLLLSACGLTGSGQRIVAADGKTQLPDDAVRALDTACVQEAESKTTGNIAGILRNLRPGSFQRAYTACVESKGLKVDGRSAAAQPAPAPAPKAGSGASAPPKPADAKASDVPSSDDPAEEEILR
jgi:hypothetical protein